MCLVLGLRSLQVQVLWGRLTYSRFQNMYGLVVSWQKNEPFLFHLVIVFQQLLLS
uniref:Uncharacterized protein n=1 Tax=Picea glauca TaxID=3330 RepID=A0A101LWR1_PICGL|nr:hypothetical protein ABT39_MTgene6237 [Picea glauca]